MYVPANNPTTSQQAPEITTAKRVFCTFLPVPATVWQMAENLADGKSVKEAWNDVEATYEQVRDANRQTLKDNLHRNAEAVRESRIYKYTAASQLIEKIDKWINE